MCSGDGRNEVNVTVILAKNLEENDADADPKDRTKSAFLSYALEGDDGEAKSMCHTNTSLDEVGYVLEGSKDAL